MDLDLKKILNSQSLTDLSRITIFEEINEFASMHHERLDGTGYPFKKTASELSLGARIMAVADVFDALISKRTYNATLSIDQAYVVIKANAGTQFDPEIAAAFIIARPKIEQAVKKTIYRM